MLTPFLSFHWIEVAYYQILEQWFKGPPLMNDKGWYIWSGTSSSLPYFFPPSPPVMVLLYWSLAFIVASAIPRVQTISGLVAAVCIMQFTYTFPPLYGETTHTKTPRIADIAQGST
ncbi:hypothetical protein BDY19DRAFT_380379 [Irpex rosettiformis]|uniref:Uncharacterized protein n=1 Tax=Irpex rosettiformis TaxID=378272 RepID=A0ACB8TVL6_9APHY|nr:hypothetical protein BDY19DRAFT_380379 [Irpex rosettiformis]